MLPSIDDHKNKNYLNFNFTTNYGSLKSKMAEVDDSLVTVTLNSSLNKESEEPSDTGDGTNSEKVLEPMLVEESTLDAVPANLQQIIEKMNEFGGSNTNSFDLIMSVIFVLMLEIGFVPKNIACDIISVEFHKQRMLYFNKFPDNWKDRRNESYNIDFILQPFPSRECKMVCLAVNRFINVNILIESSVNCVYQVRVPRYVVSEEAEFIPLKFRNLRELSVDFKNNVANKAKSAILKEEEVTDRMFQDMPSEILYNIFSHLRVKDFLRLSITCQRMKECAKYFEEKIWKHFLDRDFPNAQRSNGESSWKDKYKTQFFARIDALEAATHSARVGYRNNMHFY